LTGAVGLGVCFLCDAGGPNYRFEADLIVRPVAEGFVFGMPAAAQGNILAFDLKYIALWINDCY